MPSRTKRAVTTLLATSAVAATVVSTAQPPTYAAARTSDGTNDTVASLAVDGLADTLDRILADDGLDGATVSLTVRDASTGDVVYERNSGTRLNPASNAKLFTSLAAMGTLGPRWRFTTSVLSTAKPRHGTLDADVYLRGGGDPTLLKHDLVALAKRLSDRGVRRVVGDVVVDDHYFDHRPFGPGWAWDDTPYYYSAAISGLTLAPNREYDSGTAIVVARPGTSVGDQVRLRTRPGTGVFRFVNHGRTAPRHAPSTLSIQRDYGSNTVRVTGRLPRGSDARLEWVPVTSPTAYAADVFARALRAQGIRVAGTVRSGRTPSHVTLLAQDRSMPVSRMLVPFLKLSNNLHAEHLTKAMGKVELGRGSTANGTSVIRSYTRGLGVGVSTMRQWDGSGLSRFDLVSSRTITDVLLAAQRQPWFRTWYDALPVACDSRRMVGGTLSYRMCASPAAENMHAKTGSLSAVSALSGYVTDATNRRVIFSMLTSNVLRSDPEETEDAVGAALAAWTR